MAKNFDRAPEAEATGSAETWREIVDVLREGCRWWVVINFGAVCGAFLVAVAAVAMLLGVRKDGAGGA